MERSAFDGAGKMAGVETAIPPRIRPMPQVSPTARAQNPAGALRRLAYDELLADQLALSVIRQSYPSRKGRDLGGNAGIDRQLDRLFAVSTDRGRNASHVRNQPETWHRANACCACCKAMSVRGKTMVALFAMLQAIEAGTQAALMAPTEILAKQHHAELQQFLAAAGD